MSRLHVLLCGLSLVAGFPVFAELKALDDEMLSGVSGQSGITLDLEANTSVAEVAYFDDGKGIALQGVRLSAADSPTDYAKYRFDLDILADGALAFEFSALDGGRFEIEEIRFIDNPGLTPGVGDPSIGGIFLDFALDGSIEIRGGGFNGPSFAGHTISTQLALSQGRLGYRTNGNEMFLDGMTYTINAPNTYIDLESGGVLRVRSPNHVSELSVDAIRYSNNPLNHGVSNDVVSGAPLPSLGSLWLKTDIDTDIQISAGGAQGAQGLTLNVANTINRLDLAYGDDTDWAATGYWVGLLGATGSLNVQNLTVDVLDDEDALVDAAKDFGAGLSLGFDQLDLSLTAADLVLGETKANIDAYLLNGSAPVRSIGGLGMNLLFADGLYDGVARTNKFLLQAGGNIDAGYQGLRLDAQISLISPNNESNFVYIDDGNGLMLSKFEGFADGDITLDVTSAGLLGSTEFYDGLRIGFEDFAFGYRFEGLRAAKDSGDPNDLKNAELQAGQGIEGLNPFTFGLASAPSLSGNLNGHITLGPGGMQGDEGIAVNADLSLTDGEMASYLQQDGRGMWLAGLNYDVHLRDMMLDVTSEGLQIYQGERWSLMDVTDFKIGDKSSGASFGRLVFESFEQGSVKTIKAGGAGTVCIGGSGSDQAACSGDGGRWEDRGSEGVTISSTQYLKAKIDAENKRNRLTWETSRTGEGTADPINGSGLQLVFDNFTTNDGDGINDTFGIKRDHQFDVAQAHVVKRTNGADANGVVGNKGDIKVMNSDGTYRYVAPGDMTAQDYQDRPVGIALRTQTQFQELDIERVNLAHPVGGESTLLYGLKLQNFNVTTDITTTTFE